MDEEFRNQKVEFWKEILSPKLMALRFGSLGGIFAAIIAAIAEVPIVHSVARTAVAVALFAVLGLAAGYVLSSLDVERIILSSEYEVGEFLVLEDEGEFLGDEGDEDILSTDIYEDEGEIVESLDDDKMALAASAIKGMAGMTETAEAPQALPEPTQEVLPEIEETVMARQARKLVVSDKAVENKPVEKALNLAAPKAKELVKEIAAPAPKARRSRKLVVS